MKKRIDVLTEAQKAMFPVWVKKWTEIGLKTGETDWNTFEKGIRTAYAKANIPFPNKIIRVNSPMVGVYASSIADQIINKNRGAVRGAVGDAVGGAVVDAVRDAVRDAVEDAVVGAVVDAVVDAVRVAVGVAVGVAVEDAVVGAVEDAVVDAVRVAVRDAVGGAVVGAVVGAVRGAKQPWHYWLGGQFWVAGYWWGSPVSVSYYVEVCDLKLSKDIMERYEAYRQICESANYVWPNKDFVMVCARPVHIDINAAGRLHSDKRKAIEYPDGWGLYYLNGVKFDEKLWKAITSKTMPFKDIMNITDVDQRRQALKYGDWNEFTKYQKAEMVDEHTLCDINGELVPHQLWKFPYQENESERIFNKEVYFARYMCPSTKDWMVKGVPEFKTVAEAMSWGMSNEELGLLVKPEDWKNHIPLVTAS